MQIHDNLRKVVIYLMEQGKAGSQRELAATLGYNPSAFSQILNGRVPVSEKFLGRLSALDPRINLDWVRHNTGEMLLPVDPVVEARMVSDDDLEYLSANSKGCKFYKRGNRLFMTVRHVPYAAFGQFVNDSDRLDPVEDEWSEETYEVDRLARGHYLSFEVKGDSMDTGSRQSFESGDRVLVREWERDRWASLCYKDHPFWVVVFGSSVLIKQIIDEDPVNGTFTFHSLNPSPEYADFTLNEDEIRALYYVIQKKPRQVNYVKD